MSKLDDLKAAVDANTVATNAAVAALGSVASNTAAAGPLIDQIAANTASLSAATAAALAPVPPTTGATPAA